MDVFLASGFEIQICSIHMVWKFQTEKLMQKQSLDYWNPNAAW